jgi:glycosyltransferase involved in cell wall biosynthesis
MKIRFCSPIQSHMGYAELGRTIINQLVQAGYDVGVAEIPVQGSEADVGALGGQARALLDRHAQADVNVVTMIPPLFERYRLPGARNIGFTMFEADRLPAAWVPMCNAMDALWVPSEWVRDMFLASGVTVPVHVVGVDSFAHATGGRALPAPAQAFRLLSVFQWSARKNPVGLLRAFCAAFDGDPDAVLVLKAHRAGEPAVNSVFVKNAVDFTLSRMRPARSLPRVEIATEFYSAEQMRDLHASANAYVSLAHAEGWGLPAWEATLAGKPVVHTGWSAPLEFLHPQGLVRSNLAPTYGMEQFVPFYDIGMRWADPHLDHAVEQLRALREDQAAWRDRAATQREQVMRRYSLDARIAQLRTALAG